MLLLAGSTLAFGYHAKLMLEDGKPFPSSPLVLPGSTCTVDRIYGSGEMDYSVVKATPVAPMEDGVNVVIRGDIDDARKDICEVVLLVKGYQRVHATLHDGALIVFKREGGTDGEGTAVSLATLRAPPEAVKAYEKGVLASSRKKWPAAAKAFQRAVEIWPKHAPAWSELGDALRQMSKTVEARAAWEHAIEADPKYAPAYLQVARLAVSEGRMEDAANISERGIQTGFARFPRIYYFNAVANLGLGRLDVAEKSARKAADLDVAHGTPQIEYILGAVLAAKGDRSGAMEHMKKYLATSPRKEDAQKVRKRIEELERGGD